MKIIKTGGPRKNNRHAQSGFTLIEILVSLVLLGIGMLGLTSIVNSVLHSQKHSNQTTVATMLTTNKLEQIKRLSANEPTGGTYGFSYLTSEYLTDEGMTEVTNKSYNKLETIDGMTRTWTLNIYPSSSNETFDAPETIRMIEVVVNTQWTDERNQTHNVELASVLHRRQFLE